MKIALIGDYDESVLAHQAVAQALADSARALATSVEPVWVHSSEVDPSVLAAVGAIWCVPLSPYAEPDAVIAAIRFARETELPFLGTCAGYQHALLEYARNVLGFTHAASSEDEPATTMPLISPLACRMVDQADSLVLQPGSRLAEIYQSERIVEEFNCAYGFNQDYLSIFADTPLRFSAFAADGAVRAFELDGHRFFFATAYQPERAALQRMTHPLISSFLMAAS